MPNAIKIPALTPDASLKRAIRKHLREIGFVTNPDGVFSELSEDKARVRSLHSAQRLSRLKKERVFVETWSPKLLRHFADGSEIVPQDISPVLERIESETWQSALFRYASLIWSIPVSNGFGRRLRYLVWDECNGKLIGIIAIGDPVFNLRVRDQYVGWNSKERELRLANVMDAYVLGAIPPYNKILSGKLIACLVRTRDIYDDFAEAYGRATGIISSKKKKPRLLAVTTSSAMGRSSVYNRVKLHGVPYLRSLGYTQGWGHFHIPDDLFIRCRELLLRSNHSYANQNRFGDGPNWKLRTIRASLKLLGLSEGILHHGIKREVFISEFAKNSLSILRGKSRKPDLRELLSASEVGKLAVERWVAPRAERNTEFRAWQRIFIQESIFQKRNSELQMITRGE